MCDDFGLKPTNHPCCERCQHYEVRRIWPPPSKFTSAQIPTPTYRAVCEHREVFISHKDDNPIMLAYVMLQKRCDDFSQGGDDQEEGGA